MLNSHTLFQLGAVSRRRTRTLNPLTVIYNIANATSENGLVRSLAPATGSDAGADTAPAPYITNRPYYDGKYGLTGNNPAIVFPSDPHNKHFVLPETISVRDVIIIGCYKTGAESVFPADQALLSSPANNVVIGGLLGQNSLPSYVTATIKRWGSDNTVDNLLPMPFGMYRITFSQPIDIKYIGSRGLTDSGWLGAINEIQMYPDVLSEAEYETVIDNAVADYGVFIPKRLTSLADIPEAQFWIDPDNFNTRMTVDANGRVERYNNSLDEINFLRQTITGNRPQASRLVNDVMTPWVTTNGKRAIYFDQHTGQKSLNIVYPLAGPGYTFAAVIHTQSNWTQGHICAGNFFSFAVGTNTNGRFRFGTTLSDRLNVTTPVNTLQYNTLQLVVARANPATGWHQAYVNGNLAAEVFDDDVSISNRVTHIGIAPVLGGVEGFRGFVLDWFLVGRAVENDEITFIHDYFLNKYEIGTEAVII